MVTACLFYEITCTHNATHTTLFVHGAWESGEVNLGGYEQMEDKDRYRHGFSHFDLILIINQSINQSIKLILKENI